MTGQTVRNDNTIVINNFCFQYIKLVNVIHRMSYKLKEFKNSLDDIWNSSCFKLYMNDTNLTYSTNGLKILELYHSHIIFNVILTDSNYAILHFWLLRVCGLCQSSSIPNRTLFGNCIYFYTKQIKFAEVQLVCWV
jgi:hypothetical protein